MYGWFRIFMKIIAICLVLSFAFHFPGAIIYTVLTRRAVRERHEEQASRWDSSGGDEQSYLDPELANRLEALKPKMAKRVDSMMKSTVFELTNVELVVLAVELMIRWNNIKGVQLIWSMGQLIPLFLGIMNTLSLVLGWEKFQRTGPPDFYGDYQ